MLLQVVLITARIVTNAMQFARNYQDAELFVMIFKINVWQGILKQPMANSHAMVVKIVK